MALISANLNLQFPCFLIIQKDLISSDFMMQMSLILGPILAIPCNIFMGLWSDRYDGKCLIIFFIIAFLLGSLACGLAKNTEYFLVGRALQIIGDSGVSVIGFVLLSNLVGEIKFAKYLGFNAILGSVVGIISPLLGNWILTNYNWRWNLFILCILSTILLILFILFIPRSTNKAASSLSLSNVKNDLIFLSKLPLFIYGGLLAALYTATSTLFDFYSPFFYMGISELSPQVFSYIKASLTLIGIMASFGYIYILAHHGLSKAFSLGIMISFLFGLGITIILLTNNYHMPFFVFILTAVQGISGAFINPICMVLAFSQLENKKSIGLSIFALMRNIISTVIPLIASLLFYNSMLPIIIMILILFIIAMQTVFIIKKHVKY
jgi:MFS family permease